MAILEATEVFFSVEDVERLSSQIRESQRSTRRGLENAIPVSIAGLAVHAAEPRNAEHLLSTLSEQPATSSATDARGAVHEPSTAERHARSDPGLLERVFGARLDDVVDEVAGQSGVSRASASTLLGIAAPLVLGAVGREANARQLDAVGLSRFLEAEGRKATEALPPTLGSLVHGEKPERPAHPVDTVRSHASSAVPATAGLGGVLTEPARPGVASGLRRPPRSSTWLLGALALLMLLILIVFTARPRSSDSPRLEPRESDVTREPPAQTP